MDGTLTPPSHVVPFPPEKGPELPPNGPKTIAGPLSERKTTRVLSSTPNLSSSLTIRPTE